MDRAKLRRLLRDVQGGKVTIPEAMERLRSLPFEDLGFAKLDSHRPARKGFPEVVYCPGKSAEDVARILDRLSAHAAPVLATRADEALFAKVRDALPGKRVTYHAKARIIQVGEAPKRRRGLVLVVSAGTSDIPVAEEAAVTAEAMGSRVERLYDVGVAGVHRLLASKATLEKAKVVVVVAGMEGALPGVVAGLVEAPVVAVPTSVGYGASFGGMAALLTMMNACAPGVAVVNIDNGFGAGYYAAVLNR